MRHPQYIFSNHEACHSLTSIKLSFQNEILCCLSFLLLLFLLFFFSLLRKTYKENVEELFAKLKRKEEERLERQEQERLAKEERGKQREEELRAKLEQAKADKIERKRLAAERAKFEREVSLVCDGGP